MIGIEGREMKGKVNDVLACLEQSLLFPRGVGTTLGEGLGDE